MTENEGRRQCPDTGTCHHECDGNGCWRVRNAAPLSIAGYPGNRWPYALKRANGVEVPELDEPAFTVVYDAEEGQVVTHDFGIKRAIEVRQGLIEEAVRYAAIVELERLGYTVLAPDQIETSLEACTAELAEAIRARDEARRYAEDVHVYYALKDKS